MRLLPIESVVLGMRIALPFYNQRGGILLQRGTILTDAYIPLLRRRGVSMIWVEDFDRPGAVDADLRDPLSVETRAEATHKLASLFDAIQQAFAGIKLSDSRLVRSYLKSPDLYRSLAGLSHWDLSETADSLMEEALAANPSLVQLNVARPAESYELAHAVNTTVTGVMLGARLGLAPGDLQRFARGCLLHDIGMQLLDGQVLSKPGHLNDAERAHVEQHTTLGFELLSRTNRDDLVANHIAYQHHERQDGTGYPRGLTGSNDSRLGILGRGRGSILLLAEIAAVVDVYHALLTDHPHRRGLPPATARLALQRLAGSRLNAEIVRQFLRFAPPYPPGSEVAVTSGPLVGCTGVVVSVNPKRLDRPVVRLLANHGEPIRPTEIDMADMPEIAIRVLLRAQPEVSQEPEKHAALTAAMS